MSLITLVERIQCPVCGSRENSVYMAFPDIPVVQCNKCGFIYSSKVLSEQDNYAYYRNSYGSQRHLQGQIVNAVINSWAIAKLVDMTNVSSVLDVGTGYGFLLKTLVRNFKLDVAGVELSQQESEYAKKTMGLNVINSPLGNSGLKTDHYDLVTAFEVIEHILNPVEFIRELAQYVKPGGHLLIMTDNFCSRMARSLEAGFPKWIPHVHISHFSPVTLEFAIAKIGNLNVVNSMSYTPWEIILRDAYYRLRGIVKRPSEAFDLASEFTNDTEKEYRLFHLRKLINKIWVQITISDKTEEDMMYYLLRRTS